MNLNPLAAMLAALAGPALATVELAPVTVSASKDETLAEVHPMQGSGAARFSAADTAIPQSVQHIGSERISISGMRQMRDVLDTVPSMYSGPTRLAPFGSASWRIRGLDAGVTRNGFRQLYFEDVDQSALRHIERVDVVKGPSGTASGKEGLGGTVQIQTKRPLTHAHGEADLSVGSFDGRVTGFDTGTPLGDSGVAVRLTGELERSGSFVPQQELDRDNLGLALAFDRGGPVRAFLNSEYVRRESLPHPGLPVTGTVLPNGEGTVADEAFLGQLAFDTLHTWAPLVQTWFEFDIAEGWTLSPRYQWFTFNVNQQQTRLAAPLASDPTMIARTGRYDFHERDRSETWQLELSGQYSTGGIAHRLLAGLEGNRHRWQGDWFNYAPGAMPPVDALNPGYLEVPPARAATQSTFSGAQDTRELYVQQLSEWGAWTMLVGARWSDIETETPQLANQQAEGLSYQLGATWQFMAGTALFAGVASGLSAENIVGATSADGSPFKPEESRQFEVGIKHQGERAGWSLSLFDLRLLNATTANPDDPDYQQQTGEQRVRGVEFEGGWQPWQALTLSGGVAWLDAVVSKSEDGDVGNRLANTPRWQGNVWARYALGGGVAAHGGVRAVGERYGTQANTYALPGYATVDLGASWAVSRHLQADVTLSNAFDADYYTGQSARTVYPGEPRTFWLKLTGRY
ncbi:TonB-dependent receptor [Chitinibacteraceae bacterium HSL-7]